MNTWTTHARVVLLTLVVALVGAACSSDDSTDTIAAPAGQETFTIGVSNNVVGNSWREQMICAIKAEAKARGNVDQVILLNRDTDTAGQISDITSLISQGVDAIILNPGDPEAFNAVIEEAVAQGIVVVVVDNGVTTDAAYLVSNDQVAYGELGARWLFEELGGQGNVAYMRGIDGVGADTDRDTGFQAALADFPGITIVSEVFTDWSPTTGAQQALEILTTKDIDGIWTSGIDYSVVEQFPVAGVDYVPIVGADNNAFIGQLLNTAGLTGVAITNPPSVGGAGAAVALDILEGKTVSKRTLLTPAAIVDKADLEAVYVEGLTEGWSSYMEIEPYTTYTSADVIACKGPGE
ncbi:MAG: substrate-binding domain-containing protein [Actinomycetota bacterium]|nr:substrate-binding domain-containing protein [Actinomycetota bacterium]MDK1038648.1 substrate-binding domain-containing protein [Actinomycetota bacterium]MDK1096665.1 substrate-binding domain-containing protein [Actinomycetota bacterium]